MPGSHRGTQPGSAKINERHGLRRGRVSVSIIESVARGLMPKILSEFWADHPEINVDINLQLSLASLRR
jgi:DNA-binding transcriptional LysR family regulator